MTGNEVQRFIEWLIYKHQYTALEITECLNYINNKKEKLENKKSGHPKPTK